MRNQRHIPGGFVQHLYLICRVFRADGDPCYAGSDQVLQNLLLLLGGSGAWDAK